MFSAAIHLQTSPEQNLIIRFSIHKHNSTLTKTLICIVPGCLQHARSAVLLVLQENTYKIQLPHCNYTMKNKQPKLRTDHPEIPQDAHPPDSDEDVGFSKWLRSDDGLDNLKLFVLGNSIVLFLLISWPQVKEALDIAYYMYVEYINRANN